MSQRWGRDTLIKFLGGELLYREAGQSAIAMREKLEGIKRRALNLQPVFEKFRDVWFEQNQMVFASEGLPEPWPALSPAYAEWKDLHYPGKSMLRRTDALFGSLTQAGGDSHFVATPRTVQMGSRVPYFIYHQTGTSRMPQRRPLVLLPETFSEMNRMVVEYVIEENLDR